MDRKKLQASNSYGGAKGKQIPAASKGKALAKEGSYDESASANAGTITKIYKSGNASSNASYALFWLDSKIDMEDKGCTDTIKALQSIISTMHVFNDSNECANFLHTIKNQNVFMVVSDSLSQTILPRIHHMPQLTAVIIHCSDQSKCKSLMNGWPKVRGVFTGIDDVYKSLKQVSRQWDEETVHFSLMSASDVSGKSLNELDQSFMYTQLIKEILFELKYNDENFDELMKYCLDKYGNTMEELILIQTFQNEYRARIQTPIWWYTRECFLYKLLNEALYKQQTDILIKMGFYIHDLHQQIQELHSEQEKKFPKEFPVYRGVGLTLEQLEKIKKTKGGLLSFNSFISTSREEDVGMFFVQKAFNDGKPVAVLYNITVNTSIPSAPFANIDKFSWYNDTEKEILFSMHTIFRIGDIRQDSNNKQLWHIRLTLTGDNDPQLNSLLERMRVEIGGSSASYRLGALLIKLGKFDKAEEVYEALLKHTLEEVDQASLYFQLGYINDNKGHHERALQYYQNALKIYTDKLRPDHSNIATCYNNIGLAYDNLKNYKQALAYYQKALEIYRETLEDDDPNIGICYNSIGVAYNSLHDYPQALSFCKEAVKILERKLPKTYLSLATAYNNIGLVSANMKKYGEATSFYQRAVDIGRKVLPDDHPNLAAYRKNLEAVRKK